MDFYHSFSGQDTEFELTMPAAKILDVLQSYSPQELYENGCRPAAVLVPVQERPDGDHLILTQRSSALNSHRGQVAFPGGMVDPDDAGPLDTALRESREEIGIDPHDVRILGRLDDVFTSSDCVVTPFVGVIPFPYDFQLNPAETAALFSVPIAALLDPGIFRSENRNFPSRNRDPIIHFQYQNWDIWGATARIVKQLLYLAYEFEVK